MNITYFDTNAVSDRKIDADVAELAKYRKKVTKVIETADFTKPESSLVTWKDEDSLQAVYKIAAQFKKVTHVLLVGVGGQALGIEAVHSVLYENGPQLHILDTISPHDLDTVMADLARIKSVNQLAVCISSKSGSTTEVLTNASVIMEFLEEKFGKKIHSQTVYIGTEGSDLLKAGKKLGGHVLPMQKIIGGRYSIFSTAGLMPLALLGHDLESFLSGLQDATEAPFEEAVAESAARLYGYLKKGHTIVNFFAFDTRLVRLGKWYRQLAAESLGKAVSKNKKPATVGFLPVVSTAVELHSVGQLYFSKFPGVYTDFVSFDDEVHDFEISKKTKLAPKLKGKSMQEIHTAIYGGVIGAYQTQELPYRSTVFENDLSYSMGLFMGMRMLETMYVANLMGVNAFNQPNVELYKDKTRKILKV